MGTASPPIEMPADYALTTLLTWFATTDHKVATVTALLSTIGAIASVKQLFFDKPPASPEQVRQDSRKTRKGVAHVSGQVAAEGRASDDQHALTHRLVAGELPDRVEVAVDAGLLTPEELARIRAKVAETLGEAAATEATANIAGAAARSSAEVQQLLADGKFAEAGAAQMRLAEGGDAAQAEVWRDTARILVLTSVAQAIAAYARAVELDGSDFWTWIELSRLHQKAGSLPEARRAAEAALQHVGGERERGVAEHDLGDVAMREGKAEAARTHFLAFLESSKALAKSDLSNAQAQRDLSISYNKVGDVLLQQGDAPAALTAYRDSLAIAERLAKADPSNAQVQRDLSVSYNKVGDVLLQQGDAPAALKAYRDDVAICERLAKADPSNAQAQRDLSVSYNKVGDVLLQQGDAPAALTAYRDSLAIAERLAKADPSNAQVQRDLSVSYNKVGDVLLQQGDAPAALKAYRDGLAIAERLAKADPSNVEAQRDLFVSHYRLAGVAEAQGDKAGAIREFAAGEAILAALLVRVPGNASFARDLANVRANLARLRQE